LRHSGIYSSAKNCSQKVYSQVQSLNQLNKEFAVPEHIEFKEGPGGLIVAEVNNEGASAELFLHGAQITSFIPNGQEEVLYLSPRSIFEPGIAIRGGIPVSWPWFADHPSDKSKPAHGFARTSLWHLKETKKLSDSETEIRLGLTNSNETRKLFGHRFYLEIIFTVGSQLNIEIRTINIGSSEFTISSAFHSYYKIHNVSNITVHGLEDTIYIDKVDNFTTKRQDGPATITAETDRIYLNTKEDCVIEDPDLNRSVLIKKSGSNSTVVWNPWEEKAHAMKDLGDKDYMKFVCVETANAGDDIIKLSPGEEHKLRMDVRVEAMS
jgi:glucose-6-phosphate 1-epimerase